MPFFNLHRKKQETSDEDLLNRLRETAQTSYFDELYERYIPLVYGLCLKYLQNVEDAQDAVIDIYESLSHKAAGYEIKNFKNWLYSVVKNHCFHVLRENRKEIIVNCDSLFMESDTILNLFDEEKTDNKEITLSKCMNKLPEPQRVVILKFFIEEKSYADIETNTGYSLKSVKSYMQNAKRNLKICIEKTGLE